MAKIHLFISLDPLPGGKDLEAVCGVTVKGATAIPLREFPESAVTIAFCKACFARKYFWAITSGQESRDMEGE